MALFGLSRSCPRLSVAKELPGRPSVLAATVLATVAQRRCVRFTASSYSSSAGSPFATRLASYAACTAVGFGVGAYLVHDARAARAAPLEGVFFFFFFFFFFFWLLVGWMVGSLMSLT